MAIVRYIGGYRSQPPCLRVLSWRSPFAAIYRSNAPMYESERELGM